MEPQDLDYDLDRYYTEPESRRRHGRRSYSAGEYDRSRRAADYRQHDDYDDELDFEDEFDEEF